jgi:hypothetical protein
MKLHHAIMICFTIAISIAGACDFLAVEAEKIVNNLTVTKGTALYSFHYIEPKL